MMYAIITDAPGYVLIPSLSGPSLEWPGQTYRLCRDRLNPFFVRSLVGIQHERVHQVPLHVLIPSLSGLSLESPLPPLTPEVEGLNPFFVRSLVGIHDHAAAAHLPGLNPFFVRSLVGMLSSEYAYTPGQVLIPSLSGLSLESSMRSTSYLATAS